MLRFFASLMVAFFMASCGGGGSDSTTLEVNSSIQTIGNTKWLREEPDGYLSWQEANAWCGDKGYRLPDMSELVAVWNANGGKISPEGFEKDTFYWSREVCTNEENCHKGCAMDYDCSTDDGSGWSNDGYGHPKCVID